MVERLRKRAERHHRSLQGELLAIIEDAVRSDQSLTPAQLLVEVRGLGHGTPAESAAIVFAKPEAESVAERLAGAQLAAPSLLGYKLANVCLTKIRRQPSQREALRAAFQLADGLRIARSLGVELVSLDRKLAAASAR